MSAITVPIALSGRRGKLLPMKYFFLHGAALSLAIACGGQAEDTGSSAGGSSGSSGGSGGKSGSETGGKSGAGGSSGTSSVGGSGGVSVGGASGSGQGGTGVVGAGGVAGKGGTAGAAGTGGDACQNAHAEYEKVALQARECSPFIDIPQCQFSAPHPCCPITVNRPEAAKELSVLVDQIFKACGDVACPAIPCRVTPSGHCEPMSGVAQGLCL
jgi:hypothetical protein